MDGTGKILHEYVYLNGQPVVDLYEEPEGPPPPAPQEVIIDESEAFVFGSNWQNQSSSLAENGSYLKNRKLTDRGVHWYIDETGTSGSYDIYIKWLNPSGDGTSTRYGVRVVDDAGTGTDSTSIGINHADPNEGDWVFIGNYDVKPRHALRQYVQLTGFDNRYSNVGTFLEADAVKLVPTFAPEGYFDIRYIHSDHLRTPQYVTDDSGTIVWSAEYQPFGEALVDEDPDADLENYSLNIRFPGQYYDAESGLHYNYFRDYDPEIGRYIESDPIGLDGGENTYLYAIANPNSFYDPNGETPVSVVGLCFVPGVGWISCAAAGVAVAGFGLACIITGACEDAINAIRQCFEEGDEEEREKQCDYIYYEVDIPVCRSIARNRGAAAAQRCYASAAERYARCLRGQPLPPLDTRNN